MARRPEAPRPADGQRRGRGGPATTEHSPDKLADASIVVPAVTDPDGERWWVLNDLPCELTAYLDRRGRTGPRAQQLVVWPSPVEEEARPAARRAALSIPSEQYPAPRRSST